MWPRCSAYVPFKPLSIVCKYDWAAAEVWLLVLLIVSSYHWEAMFASKNIAGYSWGSTAPQELEEFAVYWRKTMFLSEIVQVILGILYHANKRGSFELKVSVIHSQQMKIE